MVVEEKEGADDDKLQKEMVVDEEEGADVDNLQKKMVVVVKEEEGAEDKQHHLGQLGRTIMSTPSGTASAG